MRVGVLILPEDPWPVAVEKWRRAEEMGFDHAWTYDHIAWGELRDKPWHASVPTLTAAALSTNTIRLGNQGVQTRTFVAGVTGTTTGGTASPVLVDSTGQLGTQSSSAATATTTAWRPWWTTPSSSGPTDRSS